LKLALIGTHGVGKTTLAHEICSLLKKADHNVDLVTEVARRSPFPINEATTLDGSFGYCTRRLPGRSTSPHEHAI
jgi:Cdc6-like AAA superfamily ATPase